MAQPFPNGRGSDVLSEPRPLGSGGWPTLRRIALLPLGKVGGERSADGQKLRVLVLVGSFARVHGEVVQLAGTLALVAQNQLVTLVPGHICVLVVAEDGGAPGLLPGQRFPRSEEHTS